MRWKLERKEPSYSRDGKQKRIGVRLSLSQENVLMNNKTQRELTIYPLKHLKEHEQKKSINSWDKKCCTHRGRGRRADEENGARVRDLPHPMARYCREMNISQIYHIAVNKFGPRAHFVIKHCFIKCMHNFPCAGPPASTASPETGKLKSCIQWVAQTSPPQLLWKALFPFGSSWCLIKRWLQDCTKPPTSPGSSTP